MCAKPKSHNSGRCHKSTVAESCYLFFRFKVCVCSRKRVLCTHNLTFANKRGCFAAAELRRHIYASRVCRCKSEVYFCSLKSAVLQLQAFACGLRGSFVAAKLILPVQKLCLPCSHRSAEVMLQLQSACFQLQISACSNERAQTCSCSSRILAELYRP